MFVYLITNRVNGKIYVGQHKGDNLKKYLQQKFHEANHRLKARSILYAAIRKHGRENFSIEPIAKIHGDIPKTVLDSLETFCIAFLDSRNHDKGYNICRGGEGFTGPHTEETKQKQRKASLGYKHTPEAIAKMKGEHSPEAIAKMSTTKKGKPGRVWTKESKRKVAAYMSANRTGANNPNFGKKASEETRQRMRESQRARLAEKG